MILELYLLMFSIAVVLTVLGYWTETAALEMVGYLFIFLLGMVVMPAMPGSLELKDNTTITKTGDDYHITHDYRQYTSTSYGIWLTLAAFIGFAMVFVRLRGPNYDPGY